MEQGACELLPGLHTVAIPVDFQAVLLQVQFLRRAIRAMNSKGLQLKHIEPV